MVLVVQWWFIRSPVRENGACGENAAVFGSPDWAARRLVKSKRLFCEAYVLSVSWILRICGIF
jgi:hypothetical protein